MLTPVLPDKRAWGDVNQRVCANKGTALTLGDNNPFPACLFLIYGLHMGNSEIPDVDPGRSLGSSYLKVLTEDHFVVPFHE